MDEYLIQGSTLTDIADAIREKTGDTELMTPAEMVEAIEGITGGGKTLLADYTASENVSAIQIDFTEAMQGYDLYRVVMTGTFNRAPYPYVGVNTATNNAMLNSFGAGGTIVAVTRWECIIAFAGGVYFLFAQNRETPITGAIQYFHTRAYASDAVFQAGFNIKIWGYSA